MATAHRISVDVEDTGLWKVKQTMEAAEKSSELLQHDLEASRQSSIMDPSAHLPTSGLTTMPRHIMSFSTTMASTTTCVYRTLPRQP